MVEAANESMQSFSALEPGTQTAMSSETATENSLTNPQSSSQLSPISEDLGSEESSTQQVAQTALFTSPQTQRQPLQSAVQNRALPGIQLVVRSSR